METIYIGIDGGGTRTRVGIALGDGTLLERREAKSSNIYAVGEESAKDHVRALLDEALASYEGYPIGGCCFSSAGLGRHSEEQMWSAFFDGYFNGQVHTLLTSNGLALLAGTLPQPAGLCLISGTGSICIGRNKEGAIVRSGGFGAILGDEGSAWWIAKEAIRGSLLAAEGRGCPTILGQAITGQLKLTALENLIGWANDKERTKAQIASLAPAVTDAAEGGDELATRILDGAVSHLIELVEATEARLPPSWPHHLGLGGGVLEKDRYIQSRLTERLSPRWTLFEGHDAALKGAIALAVENNRR